MSARLTFGVSHLALPRRAQMTAATFPADLSEPAQENRHRRGPLRSVGRGLLRSSGPGAAVIYLSFSSSSR